MATFGVFRPFDNFKVSGQAKEMQTSFKELSKQKNAFDFPVNQGQARQENNSFEELHYEISVPI
jgi:hypothetical protein